MKKYYKGTITGRIYRKGREREELTALNSGNKIYEIEYVVAPGVRHSYTYSLDYYLQHGDFVEYTPTLEEINAFTHAPTQMDLDSLKQVALLVINNYPKLSSQTCMGWEKYDDKSEDPNFHDGVYIFPDGNTYTLILRYGRVHIYPGSGSYTWGMDRNRVPLVSLKIDRKTWADRVESKDSSPIIEIK